MCRVSGSSGAATPGRYEDADCSRESEHNEAGHRRHDPAGPGMVNAVVRRGPVGAGVRAANNPMSGEGDGTRDSGAEYESGCREPQEWPQAY
jgi:hypothetical protein